MGNTLSRRDFLFYGSATLAGVTLGEIGRRQLAHADARAAGWRPRGVERWATSVCADCPAACGIRVRLVDDVPVKLEGNPLCPIGRGKLCAKGQAALESYFDPDRLTGPARRAGRRGENRWTSITWAEAIDQLASHLPPSPDGQTLDLLAVAAGQRGPLADAWSRFWTTAGARVAWTPAPTAGRLRPGLRALTGSDADPLFDLEHAAHVLSFGAPIVEDWLSGVWTERSFGRFRQGGSRARGRLVQVEARRSLTARKADEWIGVPSARHVSLAYGIVAVLLRENRIARSFLEEFAGNLAELEETVVGRYTPARVAAATGVPVVTILRLARELAASSGPLVTVSADAPSELVDAVFTLNALVGALERPGGIYAAPRGHWGEPDATTNVPAALAHGVFQPRVILWRDPSMLRSMSAPPDLAATLDGADLIVSFSPYLDETGTMADLLMPLHTPLEGWHAQVPAAAVAAETVALARPAVSTRLDTRDLVEVLAATAKAVGGALPGALPAASSEELVGAEIDRLFDARRGGPYADAYETAWLGQLEHGGWWTPAAATRDRFGPAVLQAGGWSDPFFEGGEIRRSLLGHNGLQFSMPPATAEIALPESIPAGGGQPFERLSALAVPGADPPPADRGAAFPLQLEVFTPALVNLAGSPNEPALFELLGQPEGRPWQLWAQLSPETAHRFDIDHGRPIEITSADGSVRAVALLVDGMPPDTIALPFVPAVKPGGRWARMVSTDARRLYGMRRISELCAVRIKRA